jgi:uncharacterized membrane protein
LTIIFALLVPGMPAAGDAPGRDIPPGWTYNPSAWPQRAGIIGLAFLQFFVARYLAAHQLGHVPHAWDPFFSDGTFRVLNSDVSKSFPISDAGLGAATYLIEALAGFLGGTRRWRTMPWAVVLFGILIVPVGVVSIVLVILQPLVVDAWCSLCLLTAILTVFMISPAVDELVATGQHLGTAYRERRFWSAFWSVGTTNPTPSRDHSKPTSTMHELANGLELNSIPWNLALCALVGLWLMVAPSVLGLQGLPAANDQLIGALVITFAAIGFGEAARAARWINLLFAAWLCASAWIFAGNEGLARWNDLTVGVVIALLTWRRGPISHRFGSWDRFIF